MTVMDNQANIYAVRSFAFRTNEIMETYIVNAENEEIAKSKGEDKMCVGYLDYIRAWEINEDEVNELVADGAEDIRETLDELRD